jgi:membrane protein DedA with SNARE-associated domain
VVAALTRQAGLSENKNNFPKPKQEQIVMDFSIIQQFPYFGLFLLLVLGVLGFPFPEDAVLILGGFMVQTGVVQPLPALIVIAGGMLLTDFFLYSVGRKYGRKIVTHKRFRKIISTRRLRRLERIFMKWGILVIFLGRHLVGIRSQIFLVAGVLKMPRPRFIVADAVSSMVTIAIMGGAGYWGGSTMDLIKKNMDEARYALIILVAIVAIAIFIWWLAVQKIRQDAEKDSE